MTREQQEAELRELKAVIEADMKIALRGKTVVTPRMLKEMLLETMQSFGTKKG
jgi:hypothetical protein